MHTLNVLAVESIKNRDLWYPTILGVLVVISAVALFCGTIYILLATNMGAQLGFLVATGGLSGLMVLLSLLWLTNPSPVNTLKGRIPAWKAVESIESGDVARSKIPAVQQINEKGHDLAPHLVGHRNFGGTTTILEPCEAMAGEPMNSGINPP